MIHLRNEIDTLTTRIRKLTGPVQRISIDTLLEMMFSLVEKKMLTDLPLPTPDQAHEIPTAKEADEEEQAKTAAILQYTATIHIK